ncbi:MAG TPA: hypothetical protein VLZ30_03725 [Verrucomicrobiae bacterium]|nr:hypothetical protein [Verrucomicrobiae bacterium]
MDICFSCPGCETHLVIDEAGAGLVIKCPECNCDLTVPQVAEKKSVPAPAVPTSNSHSDKEHTVAMKWTPPDLGTKK